MNANCRMIIVLVMEIVVDINVDIWNGIEDFRKICWKFTVFTKNILLRTNYNELSKCEIIYSISVCLE